jgi:hypothetical protein
MCCAVHGAFGINGGVMRFQSTPRDIKRVYQESSGVLAAGARSSRIAIRGLSPQTRSLLRAHDRPVSTRLTPHHRASVGGTTTLDSRNEQTSDNFILRPLYITRLGLHFQKGGLFRIYIFFEGACFGRLRGNPFGGFKPGRLGLLTRAKGRSRLTLYIFIEV